MGHDRVISAADALCLLLASQRDFQLFASQKFLLFPIFRSHFTFLTNAVYSSL